MQNELYEFTHIENAPRLEADANNGVFNEVLSGAEAALMQVIGWELQVWSKWEDVAFTADDICDTLVRVPEYKETWARNENFYMDTLVEYGIIRAIGFDAFGNFRYRLTNAKPGPLRSPRGVMITTYEPEADTKDINEYRNWLIHNEAAMLEEG